MVHFNPCFYLVQYPDNLKHHTLAEVILPLFFRLLVRVFLFSWKFWWQFQRLRWLKSFLCVSFKETALATELTVKPKIYNVCVRIKFDFPAWMVKPKDLTFFMVATIFQFQFCLEDTYHQYQQKYHVLISLILPKATLEFL